MASTLYDGKKLDRNDELRESRTKGQCFVLLRSERVCGAENCIKHEICLGTSKLTVIPDDACWNSVLATKYGKFELEPYCKISLLEYIGQVISSSLEAGTLSRCSLTPSKPQQSTTID